MFFERFFGELGQISYSLRQIFTLLHDKLYTTIPFDYRLTQIVQLLERENTLMSDVQTKIDALAQKAESQNATLKKIFDEIERAKGQIPTAYDWSRMDKAFADNDAEIARIDAEHDDLEPTPPVTGEPPQTGEDTPVSGDGQDTIDHGAGQDTGEAGPGTDEHPAPSGDPAADVDADAERESIDGE